MKVVPVTSIEGRYVTDEPFNNLRNSDILIEGISNCNVDSIVVRLTLFRFNRYEYI